MGIQDLFEREIAAIAHPAFEIPVNLFARQVDGAGPRVFCHRAHGRTARLARASTLTARQVVVSLEERLKETRMTTNPYGAPRQDSGLRPAMGEFKDRRSALVAFGLLEIFLGLGFLLLAALSLVGQAMSARVLEQEPSYRMAIPSVLFYVLLAGR